jgi:hypothetical protein
MGYRFRKRKRVTALQREKKEARVHRSRETRFNTFATAGEPPAVVASILDDPELKKLAEDINSEHIALLAGCRTIMELALRIGELLNKVKDRIGHGNFRRWIKSNCKFSIETGKRYHRLFRRLRDMPTLREQTMSMNIVEADTFLKEQREKVIRHEEADPTLLNSELSDLLDKVQDVVAIAERMIDPNAWSKWEGPEAAFIKSLLRPPHPIVFPFPAALTSEAYEIDIEEDPELVEYDEDESDD